MPSRVAAPSSLGSGGDVERAGGAIHAGAALGYGDWLRWFAYIVVFNILGGLLLVTALRQGRTKEQLEEHRQEIMQGPNARPDET